MFKGLRDADEEAFERTLCEAFSLVPEDSGVRQGLKERFVADGRWLELADLDETLLHSSIVPLPTYDIVFPVHFNQVNYQVYVRKRPHMDYFMSKVSQWFEIIVFTASQKVYADKLLSIIDPQRKWIKHRVFRDSCVLVEGNYLKDLQVLGRDLAKTAIVDNSPQARPSVRTPHARTPHARKRTRARSLARTQEGRQASRQAGR